MDAKLRHFCEYLKEFKDEYILIGGNACRVQFDKFGEKFRATEDLDIVLILENRLSEKFSKKLWAYLSSFHYEGKKFHADGESSGNSYRFVLPDDCGENSAPSQIELFSRKPNALDLFEESHLTPIPTEKGVSNFSAILLDEDYFDFLCSQTELVEDILRTATKECLIVLKAKAWLGNRSLFEEGKLPAAREGDVYKHAIDICRLLSIVDDEPFQVPPKLYSDIESVIQLFMSQEQQDKLTEWYDEGALAIEPHQAADILESIVMQPNAT